jgi:feruloyl esterase
MRALAYGAALVLMACAPLAHAQTPPVGFTPPPPPPPPAQPVQGCAVLAKQAGALLGVKAVGLEIKTVAAGALPSGESLSGGMSITGGQAGPNPEFCRVRATMKPSTVSAIRVEIWLPAHDWNGKFLGVGNFGWGGTLPYANMQAGLERGYAVAGNDTGHDSEGPLGHGGKFLLNQPELLQDYAWRANHLMTVAAKAFAAAYYGKAPRWSYWIGCSLGGLQGLIEASRFPQDYDGIVAGAPPNPLVDFNAAQLWPGWLVSRDPALALSDGKLAALHGAVVKACAGPVGSQLGYLENPAACHFDPELVLCKGADGPDCLTSAQVALVRQIYRGPVDGAGRVIFPGPALGSEQEWRPFVGTREFTNAADLLRYAAFNQTDWQPSSLDWGRDIERARDRLKGLLMADDDLIAFAARGGRLLLYVGTQDYHNPAELVSYLERVKGRIGPKGDHYARLFIMPGMNHCAGGQGCDAWDKLAAIDDWVDRKAGRQPRMASKLEQGEVKATYPLCFYPDVALHDGKGPVTNAASYACRPS